MSNVSRETNVVFVVEGKNDAAKLQQFYPGIQTLITNGSAVSHNFLSTLATLAEVSEIVLLLDPDGPGEKIRKKIVETIPSCKHVFVERKLAISKNKKKVGIEHMSKEELDKALENVLSINITNTFNNNMLFDWGLIGSTESKDKREFISNELNLGKGNAKTFLKKLNMFGILVEDVERLVKEYDRKL